MTLRSVIGFKSSGTCSTCSRTVRTNAPLGEVSSPYFFAQNASKGARLSSLLKGKLSGEVFSTA